MEQQRFVVWMVFAAMTFLLFTYWQNDNAVAKAALQSAVVGVQNQLVLPQALTAPAPAVAPS